MKDTDAPTVRTYDDSRLCGLVIEDKKNSIQAKYFNPNRNPDKWLCYLDAAEQSYARHGVASAVRRADLEKAPCPSFWLIEHAVSGHLLGGMRNHGPYTSVDAVWALQEMRGHARYQELVDYVCPLLSFGVMENKGVFVCSDVDASLAKQVTKMIVRLQLLSIDLVGAGAMVGTSAKHTLPLWKRSGCEIVCPHISVPYPNEKYSTVLVSHITSNRHRLLDPQLCLRAEEDLRYVKEHLLELEGGLMSHSIEDSCRVRCYQQSEIVALDGDVISLGGDDRVEVVDQIAYQYQELEQLIDDCPNELKQEPSRWVYYPWLHKVVHLLGPRGFRRLRSDRNRNKITPQEQRALAKKTIAVVGLSVGHSVAYTIAQEGLCGTLRIADHDELSLSNLNRIPSDVLNINLSKTVVLGRRIAELDPYINVEIYSKGLIEENMGQLFSGVDLIIDECDSIDIKFALRFKAKAAAVPVFMQTSDGGVLDIERFDLEPYRPVFHGLVNVRGVQQLAGLSNADKVPLVMAILEADKVTARLAASFIEIDEQITTWPQLASDVSFGAGMVGAAVRRWGLGLPLNSGRLRVDMDKELLHIQSPAVVKHTQVPVLPEPVAQTFEEKLLQAACRAPSGGNVQPWRFSLSSKDLSIYLDPDRSSLMDIKQRGSLLALGASLFNAEVAAARAGRLGSYQLCGVKLSAEQRKGREPVARLEFGQIADEALSSLSVCLDQRACARVAGLSAPIDAAWVAKSKRRAQDMHCQAVFLQGEALEHAAKIWAEADRIRFLTPKLHREMMSELNFAGDDLRRGIDVRTLELSMKDAAALQIAKRADAMRELAGWGGGERLGEGSQKLIQDADAMMVLSAPGPGDKDYLKAGRLLQYLWLEATRDKVGLHPMSPVFLYATSPSDLVGLVEPKDAKFLWELRAALAELCGFQVEQPLALTLRVTTKTEFTVRSEREPWQDRLLDVGAQPRTGRTEIDS